MTGSERGVPSTPSASITTPRRTGADCATLSWRFRRSHRIRGRAMSEAIYRSCDGCSGIMYLAFDNLVVTRWATPARLFNQLKFAHSACIVTAGEKSVAVSHVRWMDGVEPEMLPDPTCGSEMRADDGSVTAVCSLPPDHDWSDHRSHRGAEVGMPDSILEWPREQDVWSAEVLVRVPPPEGEGRYVDRPGSLSLGRYLQDRVTVHIEWEDGDGDYEARTCTIPADIIGSLQAWMTPIVEDVQAKRQTEWQAELTRRGVTTAPSGDPA